MPEDWTIDELASHVAEALAIDYTGAPSGRVRAVPDRRAIRWYTTIGLLDRPSGARGRQARYGPRHLRQLVAIKRLQAAGSTLAEIQAELVGATDATLAKIARLPVDRSQAAAAVGAGVADARPRTERAGFWRDRPTTPLAPDATAAVARPAGHAAAALGPPAADPHTLTGVRLAPGVTLLLESAPDTGDVAALRAAAGPLLTELARRGLTGQGRP